jgi:hypothetical protein
MPFYLAGRLRSAMPCRATRPLLVSGASRISRSTWPVRQAMHACTEGRRRRCSACVPGCAPAGVSNVSARDYCLHAWCFVAVRAACKVAARAPASSRRPSAACRVSTLMVNPRKQGEIHIYALHAREYMYEAGGINFHLSRGCARWTSFPTYHLNRAYLKSKPGCIVRPFTIHTCGI